MSGFALDRLPIYRYRATLRFQDALDVEPIRRGILFRGAFGVTLRRLVCHDMTLDCARCPLRGVCAYPAVFVPTVPDDAPARLQSSPRPFVLDVIARERPRIEPHSVTELCFTLIGSAQRALPFFVVALQRLGADGIGRRRAHFELGDVFAGDTRAFDAATRAVVVSAAPSDASTLARRGDDRAWRVRVTFLTPTDLREGGRPTAWPPTFGTLLRRIRDRVSALAMFFGGGSLAKDGAEMRALGALVDSVTTVGAEGARDRVLRRSSRTGERHPIEGVRGWAEYEGAAVAQAMPWLRLAEVVHVGKHATFGGGQITVDVLR